jgi:hypothetical protein
MGLAKRTLRFDDGPARVDPIRDTARVRRLESLGGKNSSSNAGPAANSAIEKDLTAICLQ